MGPEKPLPFPNVHDSVDDYVEALLTFVSESDMIHTLCGGVHILDFLTREPDHFSTILPQEWRQWLVQVPIPDLLDLLLREDISPLAKTSKSEGARWRDHPTPPATLLEYILNIRNLCLDRVFVPNLEITSKKLSNTLAMGMKPKKAHEVEHFASYVDSLMTDIANTTNHDITHILDFGSGQNYLGRVLASPMYERRIIAVESRQLNIDGARSMDASTKLVKMEVIWRNKKLFKATGYDNSKEIRQNRERFAQNTSEPNKEESATNIDPDGVSESFDRIQYIEKRITDGNLGSVFRIVQEQARRPEELPNGIDSSSSPQRVPDSPPELLVISLHSCGNLLHHGLRSLVLNPTVKAVAMVGCCYNLTTERLRPPTVKIPNLRSYNKRVEDCASACDPNGFPMSETLVNTPFRGEKGVRVNITARMMAVQAPQNWSEADCDSFFTRHFYRALFQKILVDRGLVKRDGSSDSGGEPVTLGSLRKSCYKSFVTYVRCAVEKLKTLGHEEAEKNLADVTDADITEYWELFKHKKHQLSIVWSFMAFSAGVVESLIVTDRWLFLREQPMVKKCWVETVFEYGLSPRNLVVVGIKE
jgi:Methyltransferase domain